MSTSSAPNSVSAPATAGGGHAALVELVEGAVASANASPGAALLARRAAGSGRSAAAATAPAAAAAASAGRVPAATTTTQADRTLPTNISSLPRSAREHGGPTGAPCAQARASRRPARAWSPGRSTAPATAAERERRGAVAGAQRPAERGGDGDGQRRRRRPATRRSRTQLERPDGGRRPATSERPGHPAPSSVAAGSQPAGAR